MGFFRKKTYSTPSSSSTWTRILEYYTGAWQQNVVYSRETVTTFHSVFSCITLISSDISKLEPKMIKKSGGIWVDIEPKGFEVIQKPNAMQNRIQFFENWLTSKLMRGNTYVLKERANNGKVIRLYILNPDLVTPLITDQGDVFYQLTQDNVVGLESSVTVPGSEIIHDRFNCLYHPLVGLSPLTACGLAAYQGLKIQENSTNFFGNMSRPSGVLTAPGMISNETAERIKTSWEANYGGDNVGKVAVLGDDLKYVPMAFKPEESQMVEQLQLSSSMVCSTFHVPKYKVDSTDLPSYNNIEALDQQYYSQCLQILIESVELCLKEGLEPPKDTAFQFDLDGLLRMDTATKIQTLAEAVKGGLDTPNEARKKLNQKPLDGGDSVYLQQQYYSLSALAKRDAREDPFDTSGSGSSSDDNNAVNNDDDEKSVLNDAFFASVSKGLEEWSHQLNY